MTKYTKSIRAKLFKYFQGKLGIKSSTKGWYRSDCPFCGGKYCFGINFSGYKSHCFKCNERGNPVTALMAMENLQTFNEAWDYLKIQQEYDAYEDSAVSVRYERKQVILPESFRLMINKEGILGGAAQYYMKSKRGLPIDYLTMKGVGYCLDGEYAGYIVFPFYRKSELIFFQGRKFMGGGPKMKNPENEAFGIGKTQIIYNEDALFIYNHIYLVESITNALTLGDNAVAILGKKISDYQLYRLLQAPFEKLTIILDDDALLEAVQLAMKVVQYKKVRVVKMPKEKDVNQLGKKKTLSIVKKAQFKDYTYYFKFRQNIA